uniref:Alpha-catulin n=1 Tax=Rhabditophanes sp. KR3021 TaxID=114890 RepID=A0AC35TK90_9BILA
MDSSIPMSASMQPSYDPQNLEIKTKSIEQTLVPLVTQITALVNFKENIIVNGRPKSDRAMRAALKVGSAVEAAIERFVSVGESISDENPEIQPEMYDACREARCAGSSISNLNGSIFVDNASYNGVPIDKAILVKAARQLLSSVTRVLLLADRVLVRHILRAEDKIVFSLKKLESCSNFTEFVKIFTEFGGEMVDLAHRSGDRQNDLKSEKRKAQMGCARTSLERLTMLLLTASKTLLRHPDDQSAKNCRDGVFHYLRLGLQLIGLCVTDGTLQYDTSRYFSPLSFRGDDPLDIGLQLTASVAIKQLTEMLEMVRLTGSANVGIRDRLISALDQLCEMTQDFTGEQILDFLEECRFEMSNLISPATNQLDEKVEQLSGVNTSENVEVSVERLHRRLLDLKKQLQTVALGVVGDVFRANEDHTILTSIKACSVSGDIDGVEKFLQKFKTHSDHLQEVCRLLHHVSLTDSLHVYSGQTERNMRALAPLGHKMFRIYQDWQENMTQSHQGRVAAEKQAYMSLPRPGVGCLSSSCCNINPSMSYLLSCSCNASCEMSVSVAGDSAFVSLANSGLSSSRNDTQNSPNANSIESGIEEAKEFLSSSGSLSKLSPGSAFVPFRKEQKHSTSNCLTSSLNELKTTSPKPLRKELTENVASKPLKKELMENAASKPLSKELTENIVLKPLGNELSESIASTSLSCEFKCLDESVEVITPPPVIQMREKGKGRNGKNEHFEDCMSLILENLYIENVEDQQKIAKVGLEMKLLTAEVDNEAEKWDVYAENDIVKRAKSMSSMAYNMYLFTRGDGPLKTTHDLFTQAEFYAEQANKMYKTVRDFHYEVPGSQEKNELSNVLERIPLHCQQLQVLVKSPTVGKGATFSKVDSVIQETKNLMNEIAKLVTACFVCATKFEIEFRGTGNMRANAMEDGGEANTQRNSRESTLWRRTPSTRRTAPPSHTMHRSSNDLQQTTPASDRFSRMA